MLMTTSIQQAEDHIAVHPISDDSKQCRLAWALAAYKLTYDPEYESYLDIDWSHIDEEILQTNDVDDLPALDDIKLSEKYMSYPWLFSHELFALL